MCLQAKKVLEKERERRRFCVAFLFPLRIRLGAANGICSFDSCSFGGTADPLLCSLGLLFETFYGPAACK